jgi:PPOX class probable F420-dependent enzyme
VTIPAPVRELLEAPNYVHLATLRKDGSPRNSVVWAGLEGEHILVCMPDWTLKAKDMLRDPRVGMSVVDLHNPYRMASLLGRVVEVRDDHDGRYMNEISIKYTSRPFPSLGPSRLCFVVEVEKASHHVLRFVHDPA